MTAQTVHQLPSGRPPAMLAGPPLSRLQRSRCNRLGSHAAGGSTPGRARTAAAPEHLLLYTSERVRTACITVQAVATAYAGWFAI